MNQQQTDPPFRFDYFIGFDWAKDHHDVVVVDSDGRVVDEFRFEHSAQGWSRFRERITPLGSVAVTIENSVGPAVERLLELGLHLYPVHPKAAQRYRDRKAPAGVKNDRLDAWSIADALRTDGHGWRCLRPHQPLIAELRLLCRDEVALIETRTALINQLQTALYAYYPAALEAFDDWTLTAAWHFVVRFPTPEKLQKAGRRKWENFLKKHRCARTETLQKRLEICARATQFQGIPPVVAAKCQLAVAIAKQLITLQEQLDLYRKRITELFEQHPDRELFASLPGAGEKIAPRLLAEIGDDRQRFESPQSIQCVAGTAPVSFQSGQLHKVRLRRACNKSLRAAVHLWANLSRNQCHWAKVYYRQKREQGKSHACALRCLGQRWLKILWTIWKNRNPYDEALHIRNQTTHGSWVVQLVHQTAT
jgi:transposase